MRLSTEIRRPARVAGLLVGLAAVGVATAITAGVQVASSPIATAGPKPTATASGAADPHTAYAWYQKLGAPYNAMQDSLAAVGTALNTGDVDALHAACRDLRVAAGQYAALLPSPDSRATFRIQGVVDDLNAAADICMGFGPGINWEGAKPMSAHIDDANARLRSAKQILAPGG